MFYKIFMTMLVLQSLLLAASNQLDSKFGTNGKVTTSVQGYSGGANAIVIADDGSIFVAGSVFVSGYPQFAMARYESNGTLSSSFGVDGTLIIDDFGSNQSNERNSATSIAIDNADKILVGGISQNKDISPRLDYALVRLDKNGIKDTTFGNSGIVVTDFWGDNDTLQDITVQKGDDKILVAGAVEKLDQSRFALVRYEDNGSLDRSFGKDGLAELKIDGSGATSMAIQENDDKIVAAGWSPNATTGNREFRLCRYETNGTIDASFGNDGNVTTGIGDSEDHAEDLAVQKDGKIIVAGYTIRFNDVFELLKDLVIVRYKTDGTPDSSFGTGGIIRVADGNNSIAAYGVAIQDDGKIVVTGTYGDINTEHFMIAKFLKDGTPDGSFGTSGMVVTVIGNGSGASGIAIDKNGKSVVAGRSESGSGQEFTLLRYVDKVFTVFAPLYYLLQ